MKKQILILTALTLTGFTIFAQQNPKKINIGLVPPLSSNWITASRDTNSFSLNAIAGVSAAETGFTLAGFANIVPLNADGLLIAGFLNTADSAKALELAGFTNIVRNNASGLQIAGFLNTTGSNTGLEIAGFGNFAKSVSNTQIAGFINVGGNVTALQTAGFINVAKNVNGVQVAGFINKAKNVKGVQFAGFINIADTADCQIGIINISKNGEANLGATIDDNQTALLSLRSGGKFLYGIIGVGYNLSDKKNLYAFEAGMGAHIVHAAPFRLNTELISTSLLNFKGLNYYRSAFVLLPSVRLADRVDLFAGPSLNYLDTNSSDEIMRHKNYISTWGGKNGDDFHGFYFGYNVGITFLL